MSNHHLSQANHRTEWAIWITTGGYPTKHLFLHHVFLNRCWILHVPRLNHQKSRVFLVKSPEIRFFSWWNPSSEWNLPVRWPMSPLFAGTPQPVGAQSPWAQSKSRCASASRSAGTSQGWKMSFHWMIHRKFHLKREIVNNKLRLSTIGNYHNELRTSIWSDGSCL